MAAALAALGVRQLSAADSAAACDALAQVSLHLEVQPAADAAAAGSRASSALTCLLSPTPLPTPQVADAALAAPEAGAAPALAEDGQALASALAADPELLLTLGGPRLLARCVDTLVRAAAGWAAGPVGPAAPWLCLPSLLAQPGGQPAGGRAVTVAPNRLPPLPLQVVAVQRADGGFPCNACTDAGFGVAAAILNAAAGALAGCACSTARVQQGCTAWLAVGLPCWHLNLRRWPLCSLQR